MGHKAQYIDCLAKLIDLAIELDFAERVYDFGSKAKEVTIGPNEDNFDVNYTNAEWKDQNSQ